MNINWEKLFALRCKIHGLVYRINNTLNNLDAEIELGKCIIIRIHCLEAETDNRMQELKLIPLHKD